jgi:hypothetical protein
MEGCIAEFKEHGFQDKDLMVSVVDYHEMFALAKRWKNLTGDCLYGEGPWESLLRIGMGLIARGWKVDPDQIMARLVG